MDNIIIIRFYIDFSVTDKPGPTWITIEARKFIRCKHRLHTRALEYSRDRLLQHVRHHRISCAVKRDSSPGEIEDFAVTEGEMAHLSSDRPPVAHFEL